MVVVVVVVLPTLAKHFKEQQRDALSIEKRKQKIRSGGNYS